MNISFSVMFHSVMEGGGFLELTLIKTEGAVGPVTVSLFTAAESATGETYDAHIWLMLPNLSPSPKYTKYRVFTITM